MNKVCKSILKVISNPYFIWALIAIILFTVSTDLLIVRNLNKFEADSQVLYEQSQIIQQDFEKVYLQDNYSIFPKDNAIVVRLTKGACTLASYFTHEKEFTHYQIEGAHLYTEKSAPIVVRVGLAVLSIGFAGLLVFPTSLMINKILTTRKAKKETKGQH